MLPEFASRPAPLPARPQGVRLQGRAGGARILQAARRQRAAEGRQHAGGPCPGRRQGMCGCLTDERWAASVAPHLWLAVRLPAGVPCDPLVPWVCRRRRLSWMGGSWWPSSAMRRPRASPCRSVGAGLQGPLDRRPLSRQHLARYPCQHDAQPPIGLPPACLRPTGVRPTSGAAATSLWSCPGRLTRPSSSLGAPTVPTRCRPPSTAS